MNWLIILWACYLLRAVSTLDPFEGLFVMAPCFEVIQSPECDTTLAKQCTTQNPPIGANEPNTKAYLFTSANPEKAEQLHMCGGRLPIDTTYNSSAETEIFIHGWLDGVCRTAWMREMKDQLMLRGPFFNVILMDWSWGNTPDYIEASMNCRVVGEHTGFIINNIMQQTGVGPEKFHIVGHSFGAIAAGFTGRSVPGLRRITGLDPAFAPLKNAPPNQRLSYRDAQIVDIIHSNAPSCFALGLGDARLLGHADFYPNGGVTQISCYTYMLQALLKGDLLYAVSSLEPRLCSHLQSAQFYKVSINPKGSEFVGIASSTYARFQNRTSRNFRNQWAVMGMDYELYQPRTYSRRKYFLNTINTCPYYALDPFEGAVILAPCFEVIEHRSCDSSLSESFQSQNPPAGLNDPNTLVYLFTPSNPDRAEQLHLCGGRLPRDTQYDPSLNTEIFIHGWLDGVCRTAWMLEMKEQLFQRGNYNAILVDWSWGNTPDYYLASQNCKVVGEQVGFIINNIMEQMEVGPEMFHVVGHSFGGIASGYVGRSVPGLRRITALDPAYAPLANAPPDQRVTYRDAQIVDIIHTDGGSCFVLGFGDERFLGDADFYPNGGTLQLSCYPYILKSLLKGDLLYALITLIPQFCSHLQVLQYYKVSINPKGCEFVGVADTSYESFLETSPNNNPWAVMGMDYELYNNKNDSTRSKYYLKTKLNCPYNDNSYLGQRQFPFKTSCSEGD